MNDVIGNRGDSEVPDNTDDHKDQISSISSRKEGVAIILNLADVQDQHFFLDGADDSTEDIGNR